MTGYGGRTLHVDLTTGRSEARPLDPAAARAFLGGNGLLARLLWEAVPGGVDALDPASAVGVAVGPVTDTLVPGNSRACVAGRSPLTGGFFDSTFGGRFPATLKRTGFDAVVVTGRAAHPVYLVVSESGAALRDARPLWGLTTREAVETIQAAEGADADALAIGPAGERRVRFACLAHYWKNREGVAGRGGLGAVCGAKHLKAICVTGSRKTAVADPARLRKLVEDTREAMQKGTANLSTYGTPFLTGPINAIGGLGAYNLRHEVFTEWELIDGRSLKAHYHDRDTTCLKCPVACGKQFAVPPDVAGYGGTRGKMPEYETLFAFGSMLGNANAPSIIRANILCDLLGLDSISMGVTLAFVAECLERRLLTPADVGLPFGWGDHAGMIRLIEATARREGFGDRLAEGSWRLAARIGQGAERLPYAVKGLELPAHSARALKGMSIGYATATRGGSHHDTRPTPQYAPGFDRRGTADKPGFAAQSQHFTAVDDSLVLCRFTSERGFGVALNDAYAGLVSAVTGWDLGLAELERIGERIVNLERLFNVREGVRRQDDVLPWKVMHEPIPDGPSAGMHCPPAELASMLDAYYVLRGWDADGVPTPERLATLNLDRLPGVVDGRVAAPQQRAGSSISRAT